jgi:nicotinamidase-related amidase
LAPKPYRVQSKVIKITVRNASYPIHDPGGNNLSKHYKLRERQIDIPLNQTALILIDTWELERKRFESSNNDDIAKQIKPLLKMARAVDMLVLHAPHRPIGWDGINHKQRDLDLRGPSDTPRSVLPVWVKKNKINKNQWPPVEFIFRLKEYSKYSRYSNPLYIPYPKILGIHKDLLPKKREREFIASSFNDVQKIFKDYKILHLLYAGAATNQCIVMRPVGIRNMSAHGYNTIIIRNATIGSELHNTIDSQRVTKAAILDIEINNGFSVDKDDLFNALKSLNKRS